MECQPHCPSEWNALYHGCREAFTHYFPEVSGSVLAFHTFDKLVKGDGVFPEEIAVFGEQYAAMVGQPFAIREMNKGYAATLSAVQPLFSGGRIVAGNKLTAIQQEAMRLKRSLTEKEVLQKVTECFWQIATVRYHLQTLDAADRQMEAVLSDTQRAVTIEIPDAEPVDPHLWYASAESAVELREEWQLAGRQVEAQRWQVRMERGKHLPTFAVGVMGMQSGFGGLSPQDGYGRLIPFSVQIAWMNAGNVRVSVFSFGLFRTFCMLFISIHKPIFLM